MARTKYESLESAQKWVAGIPQDKELEAAPVKEGGGKTPSAHWRQIRRDLSDLERDKWWHVRAIGTTDGVHIKIPGTSIEVVDAVLSQESLRSQQEDLWRKMGELYREKIEFLEKRSEMASSDLELEMRRAKIQAEYQKMATDAMALADRRGQETANLVQALAASEARAAQNDANLQIVRSLNYAGDKIVDLALMWRLRKHYDKGGLDGVLSVLPSEWKEDFAEFLRSESPKMDSWETLTAEFLSWRRKNKIEDEGEEDDESEKQ